MCGFWFLPSLSGLEPERRVPAGEPSATAAGGGNRERAGLGRNTLKRAAVSAAKLNRCCKRAPAAKPDDQGGASLKINHHRNRRRCGLKNQRGPRKAPALWGKELQRSVRAFRTMCGNERSGACNDARGAGELMLQTGRPATALRCFRKLLCAAFGFYNPACSFVPLFIFICCRPAFSL